MERRQTLFFRPKHPQLAQKIKISSPIEFRRSIQRVMADGYSVRDQRALVLAQNRAKAQLKRRNLSLMKRRQFTEIARIQIPSARR